MVTTQQLDSALSTALQTAGRGHRGANPLVGASILDGEGNLIATGYHLGAGHPHAEVDALRRLGKIDPAAAEKLTMIVTLEPCNHTGRTGPCAAAIANAGIGSVYYAVSDNTAASGGAEYLRGRGIPTTQFADDAAARELNHRWFLSKEQARPFITVKLAQSLDARINAPDGTSQWITSAESRDHAHGLRARVDGILIGTNTAVIDNPRLSARTRDGQLHSKQPYRLVMGQRELPGNLALAEGEDWEQIATHDVHAVIDRANELGLGHLLIEGGATVASAFIEADLADELYCYQAPLLIGAGSSSVNLPTSTLSEAHRYRLDTASNESLARLGDDIMLHLEPLPGV
ncbi:bifunctional diaminohydroxyphosphoribosylaminopyrimidine deaminase/5-amino-6-(5-phosphoribosylamino)uracil reductase RibD [Glutamicibacter sp. JL.03c]|uniref:bifunctional diaminohydroxyphosphoribosylaminopyrimidine deaminase/5-amino-6-(5-phosphoribosylamino)uracil reductase RibD n=1 Tax=Glutamicibacter sp. JL.03c TaxID=2984842 RepID=UPI0021F6E7A8|nr:bifunctional diaminohydroxyphosphoribosylaminopyrimidine deaminase/5-amino-6-(5-phosphoribosylamino)uracil reductase RibD [Glutamicibacter sp. JL.03c]UYQ76285.1 bifunctional diaminohydroxyphosphoribosylaminopyrimidine deaminase/5-amino-6-(5-phosphoribosylamino)uracil reductase RibD [Glutamicibacter sp. JL.03c]